MKSSKLHILTRPADELARSLIEEQQRAAVGTLRRFDLTAEIPDYAGLLEAIFEADAVAVW